MIKRECLNFGLEDLNMNIEHLQFQKDLKTYQKLALVNLFLFSF